MNQLDRTALCRRPNKKLWMYGKTHLLEQPCSHIKVMKGMDIQLDLYPLMTRRSSRYPSQETGLLVWLNLWTSRRDDNILWTIFSKYIRGPLKNYLHTLNRKNIGRQKWIYLHETENLYIWGCKRNQHNFVNGYSFVAFDILGHVMASR